MTIEIGLAGNDRVEARLNGYRITTDQDGSAPSPFDLFLASIGTCAGFYVSRFCRQRGLPTEGIRIRQQMVVDPATHSISRIDIALSLPEDFPDRYRDAVVRAAGQCTVKRHLERPPEIAVAIEATSGARIG